MRACIVATIWLLSGPAFGRYPDPSGTLPQTSAKPRTGIRIKCDDGTRYALTFGPNRKHLTITNGSEPLAALVAKDGQGRTWAGGGWEVEEGGDSYAVTAKGKPKTTCISEA